MFQSEGRNGAIKARLRMNDQLDRDSSHHLGIASLEPESFAKARSRQQFAKPETESARQDHRACAVSQRKVPDEASEGMAKPVDCGGGKRVFATEPALPDRLIIERFRDAVFSRRDRLIYFDDPRPRMDSLGRHAQMLASQAGEHPVVDRVEWREFDVPTFGRLDMIPAFVAMKVGYSEPGAGADHRHRAP